MSTVSYWSFLLLTLLFSSRTTFSATVQDRFDFPDESEQDSISFGGPAPPSPPQRTQVHGFSDLPPPPPHMTQPPLSSTSTQTAGNYLLHLAQEQSQSQNRQLQLHNQQQQQIAALSALQASPFGGDPASLQGRGAPSSDFRSHDPYSTLPQSTLPSAASALQGLAHTPLPVRNSAFHSYQTTSNDPYTRYTNLLRARNSPLAAHFIYHHGHQHDRPPLIQRIHANSQKIPVEQREGTSVHGKKPEQQYVSKYPHYPSYYKTHGLPMHNQTQEKRNHTTHTTFPTHHPLEHPDEENGGTGHQSTSPVSKQPGGIDHTSAKDESVSPPNKPPSESQSQNPKSTAAPISTSNSNRSPEPPLPPKLPDLHSPNADLYQMQRDDYQYYKNDKRVQDIVAEHEKTHGKLSSPVSSWPVDVTPPPEFYGIPGLL